MRSVPGADRGPSAGSPRGVVIATGSRDQIEDMLRVAVDSNQLAGLNAHRRVVRPEGSV